MPIQKMMIDAKGIAGQMSSIIELYVFIRTLNHSLFVDDVKLKPLDAVLVYNLMFAYSFIGWLFLLFSF